MEIRRRAWYVIVIIQIERWRERGEKRGMHYSRDIVALMVPNLLANRGLLMKMCVDLYLALYFVDGQSQSRF